MTLADLRGRKRTLVVVSVVMIAFGWFLHPDSDATVGQFRSVAGRNEYVTHYQEAMRRFPTPPDMTADIDTDFGAVRVYEWHTPETRDSMPVVLIPGRSSGAPMWADNLAAFSSHHRVIVFDALGDASLSVQAAPLAGIWPIRLRTLTMPCYVAIAGTDSLAGGDKAKHRAGELLPHAQVDVWPAHIHSPCRLLNGWGRNSPNSGKRHRDE